MAIHPSGIDLPPANTGKTGDRLNTDINQIERMEADLVSKVEAAAAEYGLTGLVHGVFSLDDLEDKIGADLCGHIGLGVGFLKIVPSEIKTDPKAHLNVGQGNSVKMLDFYFLILMAVPTGNQCSERHLATKVFTALRFDIQGSVVAGDVSTRTWAFVQEGPDVSQSTDTMLFYSQLWRIAMPNVGSR